MEGQRTKLSPLCLLIGINASYRNDYRQSLIYKYITDEAVMTIIIKCRVMSWNEKSSLENIIILQKKTSVMMKRKMSVHHACPHQPAGAPRVKIFLLGKYSLADLCFVFLKE